MYIYIYIDIVGLYKDNKKWKLLFRVEGYMYIYIYKYMYVYKYTNTYIYIYIYV